MVLRLVAKHREAGAAARRRSSSGDGSGSGEFRARGRSRGTSLSRSSLVLAAKRLGREAELLLDRKEVADKESELLVNASSAD